MMNLDKNLAIQPLLRWNGCLSLLFISLLSLGGLSAQDKGKEPKTNPNAAEARSLIIEGTEAMSKQEGVVDVSAFAKAESNLREAISLDPASVPAKYNAGTNYYKNKKWEESTAALVYATEVATTKTEKHKAFHNLGNALFQRKNYKAAVEAYKNALRNNPTDEETRYNLQLAKKEEEKDGGGGGGGDDDKEKEDQEKNEKDNKGDGDEKESDDGKEKETDDEGKEKKDEGEQKEDENGKPDEKEKKQDGGEGDNKKEQPQKPTPQQGQLSPQRVQSLLKAMQDQEQKTQEKINAQKTKGAKVKTEKDW